MKNKSDILKHIKIKLLHGTEDASNIMVGLSEIDRFHSGIVIVVIAGLYGIYLLKMKESSETMHEQGDFKHV